MFEEIKKRRAAITPGVWKVDRKGEGGLLSIVRVDGNDEIVPYTGMREEYDADFIAHAPTDIDRLVAEVEQLQEESVIALESWTTQSSGWYKSMMEARELREEVKRLQANLKEYHDYADACENEIIALKGKLHG